MTLKIKTKVFSGFLKKARMSGTQAISETILKFEKDGLKIEANSEPQQARTSAWLKKDAFKEYEELGNVGLSDFENVTRVLDRFGEWITINKEGNLMTVKGDKKSVDIELTSEDFLSSDTGNPELEWDETFSIDATKLKDILKDVQMNKDAILTITTAEKNVSFSNTGKYKFRNEVEAPACKGETKVKFGQPFIDAVSVLDGNLEFSVKSDYPVKVMEKTDTSVVTFVIAPHVSEE